MPSCFLQTLSSGIITGVDVMMAEISASLQLIAVILDCFIFNPYKNKVEFVSVKTFGIENTTTQLISVNPPPCEL